MSRAAALLAALGALLLPAAASAADGALVGIRPADAEESWTVLRLHPGAQARAQAVVLNLSDSPQVVHVSAADAATTEDGVFTLAGEGERPQGVGAWIRPDARLLRLAPGERRPLGFAVGVPGDAEPGDHAGGLVVRAAAPAAERESGGVAVRVVERVGLRVYVTVPGRRDGGVRVAALEARASGGGGVRGLLGLREGVDVRARVRHVGNVHYAGLHGRLDLVEDGEVVASRPVDLGALLPGDEREVAARLPLSSWPPGSYRVRLHVAAAPPAQAEAAVGVSAWRVYAAGGLVLALMGTGGGAWLRRRRRAA